MFDSFLCSIQSDDYASMHDEILEILEEYYEEQRKEVRQENLQEESRRIRAVHDVQKTGIKSGEPERERFF